MYSSLATYLLRVRATLMEALELAQQHHFAGVDSPTQITLC